METDAPRTTITVDATALRVVLQTINPETGEPSVLRGDPESLRRAATALRASLRQHGYGDAHEWGRAHRENGGILPDVVVIDRSEYQRLTGITKLNADFRVQRPI